MHSEKTAPIRIKGGKTGVLLLHGFTGTPFIFRELAEQLALLGYTVYAPLIAGHGTSPQDLSKTTWHDWFLSAQAAYRQLCDETDTQYVIGASFGCNLACMLAATHTIRGVILIGYPHRIYYHQAVKGAATLLKTIGVKYYGKPSKDFSDKDSVFSTTLGAYRQVPLKSLLEFIRLIGRISETVLPKVTQPTLIIQSRTDGLVKASSGTHVLERLGSTEKRLIWINEPHHRLHVGESKIEIYALIRQFMIRYP
jgi:carboxylesterase